MGTTVSACAYRHADDIDGNARADPNDLTGLANVCVAQATSSLETCSAGYGDLQRGSLSNLLTAMQSTHRNIIRLLAEDEPGSVDALAFARLQLETLYAVCLMLEGPEYVNCYLREGWSKQYMQFLLWREEYKGLPRFDEYLRGLPTTLGVLRNLLGITMEQQMTIERDELGVPLPAHVAAKCIPHFPTPHKAISKITSPDRKRMLERLYPEYRQLCSFSHGSAQSSFFKTIFNKRLPYRDLFGEPNTKETFNKQVVSAAFMMSFLSITQASAELTQLYPGHVELRASVTMAWNALIKGSLLARAIWEIRTRRLLGIVA